jgi:hypothetical protein
MSNVIEFVSFNLKKEVTVSDFLNVSDKFNREFLSIQKGYISRNLLHSGEQWADSVLWETMEDVLRAYKIADQDAIACEYLSYLDEESEKVHLLPIERSY